MCIRDRDTESVAPACGPEYVEYIRKCIRTSYDFARDHLGRAAIRQKKGYDAYARDRPKFKKGDFVRYYYPPAKQSNKFARPWIGPFKVEERVTQVDYRITLVSDLRKSRVVHIDSLKPYEVAYGADDIPEVPQPLPRDDRDVVLDHPDHLDPAVDSLETVENIAPENLQTRDAMLRAHKRISRLVKPPKRFVQSPRPTGVSPTVSTKDSRSVKKNKVGKESKVVGGSHRPSGRAPPKACWRTN